MFTLPPGLVPAPATVATPCDRFEARARAAHTPGVEVSGRYPGLARRYCPNRARDGRLSSQSAVRAGEETRAEIDRRLPVGMIGIGSTRDRMIETASRLFQARGYAATSWRDLISEAGTPWGSAHHHFPGGKEQLAVAAVEFGSAQVALALQQCLEANPDVASAVRAWFNLSAEALHDANYCGGCPIAPLALETTPELAALSTACSASFHDWQQTLTRALVDSGVRRRRAAELAMLTIALLEGALLLARSSRDRRPVRTAGKQAAEMLAEELRK